MPTCMDVTTKMVLILFKQCGRGTQQSRLKDIATVDDYRTKFRLLNKERNNWQSGTETKILNKLED